MTFSKNMIIKMIGMIKKRTTYYHLAVNRKTTVTTDTRMNILEGMIVMILGNIKILLISSLETEINLILR